MLSNISDLFTMASLVICMLLSGIIFYYLRTRISMLEQSVMDQAQLLQQVVTSLKSSQYKQMTANANPNTITTNIVPVNSNNSNQTQMDLIQVSDDSDSDDSDESDTDNGSDDSSNHDHNHDENERHICTLDDGDCKVIDLSTISSPVNYFKPSHSEIKVIELTSNVRSGHEYANDNDSSDNDNDDDDDDDYDDDDDDEGDDDDDQHSDGHEVEMNHHRESAKNNIKNENRNNRNNIENEDDESKHNEMDSQHHVSNSNNKKMKSIIIEDPTSSISLDEMKNMPVNSLRTLAKTKLSNMIDIPTINKMSKKDILKALHE